MDVQRPEATGCPVLSLPIQSLKTGSLPEPGAGLAASKPQWGPLSPSPTPELQVQACVNTSSFLHECWDLNSSPYTCTAGILIAEFPAPRPVTFARVLIVFLPAWSLSNHLN